MSTLERREPWILLSRPSKAATQGRSWSPRPERAARKLFSWCRPAWPESYTSTIPSKCLVTSFDGLPRRGLPGEGVSGVAIPIGRPDASHRPARAHRAGQDGTAVHPINGGWPRALNRDKVTIVQHERQRRGGKGSPRR